MQAKITHILKALSLGPQHGWAVSERIRQVSRETLEAEA